MTTQLIELLIRTFQWLFVLKRPAFHFLANESKECDRSNESSPGEHSSVIVHAVLDVWLAIISLQLEQRNLFWPTLLAWSYVIKPWNYFKNNPGLLLRWILSKDLMIWQKMSCWSRSFGGRFKWHGDQTKNDLVPLDREWANRCLTFDILVVSRTVRCRDNFTKHEWFKWCRHAALVLSDKVKDTRTNFNNKNALLKVSSGGKHLLRLIQLSSHHLQVRRHKYISAYVSYDLFKCITNLVLEDFCK